MRIIRSYGSTRSVALPLSYLRDLGIQDGEYVAITLEDNYIAIHKPGAQINNPYGGYTPSWQKERKDEQRGQEVSNDIAGSDSPASKTDSDVV